MIQVSLSEAKTKLSDLVKRAQAGDQVILTSGPEQTPVARIEAICPASKMRLGALETPGFILTPAFFEPLPEEELHLCSGQGE